MKDPRELFLATCQVTLKELSKISGQSYEMFRKRPNTPLSKRGKAFWYLLTGDKEFTPASEEQETVLELEHALLQQEALVQFLTHKWPQSPLLKNLTEIPTAMEVLAAMDQVGQWNISYLLTQQTYQPLLEGGVFGAADIAHAKRLIDEAARVIFIAAHQKPAERLHLLKELEQSINALYLNIQTLGAENPFLAAKELSPELLKKK